jgi:hypothetical protein
MRYPRCVPRPSPTAEGFRAALGRPSFTLAEITWRWTAGASAIALFWFGVIEYLRSLPVSNMELLFLRTRQPYLVSQALAHILRGSLSRVVAASLVAGALLMLLWIVAAAIGRMATVRNLLDYFRIHLAQLSVSQSPQGGAALSQLPVVGVSRDGSSIPTLLRINFLRAVVALAAIIGFVGAAIFAGFASPDSDPQPGLAFLLFLFLAAIVCLAWWTLNWFLSLAAVFAVRDRGDILDTMSAAVRLCRERMGAVFAVTGWTGLAHLVAFVGASIIVSMPIGLAPSIPGRLVILVIALITVLYFAVADWLYMARLAGYVCIAEMPEAMYRPQPLPIPPVPPSQSVAPPMPVETSVDKNESILSDLPNPIVET